VPQESYLVLDGEDDYVATGGPALLTSQSFTVSAKVWIAAGQQMTGNKTAVSQDSNYVSAFYLGYRQHGGTPRWSFTMKGEDTDVSAIGWDHAYSPVALTGADQGKWVHLRGVYEADTRAMRLYVDGVLAGVGTRRAVAVPWDAPGAFVVGRAMFTPEGGSPDISDAWPGRIDEVRAYQGIVRTNIAVGKATTTDGNLCAGSTTGAKAVDGLWNSATAKWCSAGATKWLQVDLGSVQKVREFTLLHARAGGEDMSLNTKDFTIQVSADGTSWTTVVTTTGSSSDVTHHYLATAANARYVRLNVTAGEQGANNAARIYEFQIYN
jgi:hypothetical protein